MSQSEPSENADGQSRTIQVSDEAVRRLAEAVARLSNDPVWFLNALTETVLATTPISMQRLTKQQRDFLIEAGAFTAETLASTSEHVDRGALQLGAAEVWLSNLVATMSLNDVAGFLELDEDAVRAAVREQRLYAVEISGRLRFPRWQFDLASPGKLLPGLTEIIAVITPRWDWRSAAAFFATPQSDLRAEGRLTPVQWLRDGGDADAVREIIEASDIW